MEFICQDCSIESVLNSMPKMKELTLLGAIVHTLKGHKVISAWEGYSSWKHWIKKRGVNRNENNH